jgi:hypothetical protein
MAHALYKDSNRHEDIRKMISNKFIELLNNQIYKDLWISHSVSSKKKSDTSPEERLVSTISLHFAQKEEINDGNSFMKKLYSAASNIEIPARPDNPNSNMLDRYGGSLEISIFSFITERNIYTLQNTAASDSSFRWFLQSTFKDMAENEIKTCNKYYTFYYKTNKSKILNHYNMIVQNETVNPPDLLIEYANNKCNIIEHHNGTMSHPISL